MRERDKKGAPNAKAHPRVIKQQKFGKKSWSRGRATKECEIGELWDKKGSYL